jgi:hypothetical protein
MVPAEVDCAIFALVAAVVVGMAFHEPLVGHDALDCQVAVGVGPAAVVAPAAMELRQAPNVFAPVVQSVVPLARAQAKLAVFGFGTWG